jgi:hypothetical protein
MSTYDELLAVVKAVRDRTGDPNAWQMGLAPNEIAAAITPSTRSEQLDTILSRIRRQHPDVFGAGSTPSDQEQGEAAQAMATAEAALAHQNSASSQLDLQVISAILNAHLKTVEGSEALTTLQQETEAAVRTRSDLDTPAGARDFQRFLIGKLRDIRAVVASASLDDTSKSALMVAWTSLYEASKGGSSDPSERQPPSSAPVAAPASGTTPRLPDAAASGSEPPLDSLLADDPGLLAGDAMAQSPAEGATAPAPPMMPAIPSMPNPGAPPLGAASPGALTGWGAPSGTSFPGLQGGGGNDPALARLDDEAGPGSSDEPGKHDGDHEDDQKEDEKAASDKSESPAGGPTSVTLPDGETVTAASPQLAAAIKAAVGGVPIADAFHQQGIVIPPPGTAVSDPIDPFRAIPGDIGFFTDRHALALGHSKALLDGQIQQIATVSGPSFLGWDHPPAAATATAPATTAAPTPTRPAATSTL